MQPPPRAPALTRAPCQPTQICHTHPCLQRKKTLLVEYKQMRKANTFIDRRFGGEWGGVGVCVHVL